MDITVRNWAKDVKNRYCECGGRDAMVAGARAVFNAVWFAATSQYPVGTNIYEKDWDALVVLDGCRVDALRTIASEYSWLDYIDSIWSVGSASHEWTAKTFTRDYEEDIADTALVTANPFAEKVFNQQVHPPHSYVTPFDISRWDTVTKDSFAYTEWCFNQKHDYEDLFPTQPARHMTDRAILTGRKHDVGRLIIHYFQPHRPFIFDAIESGELNPVDDEPYAARQDGCLTQDELWSRYLNNLRYVLDDVELLRLNLDADRLVITADHGELMGELGQYGHPEGVPHPALKKVPWTETTASDSGTYQPDPEVECEGDYDTDQQLKDLGYL